MAGRNIKRPRASRHNEAYRHDVMAEPADRPEQARTALAVKVATPTARSKRPTKRFHAGRGALSPMTAVRALARRPLQAPQRCPECRRSRRYWKRRNQIGAHQNRDARGEFTVRSVRSATPNG